MNVKNFILLFIFVHVKIGFAELLAEERKTEHVETSTIISSSITPETWTELIVEDGSVGTGTEPSEKSKCVEIEVQPDRLIQEFGKSFSDLSNFTIQDSNFFDTANTILFVGNTGSGKSTLVQTLAGDNSKLIAEEVSSESGDFTINGLEIGTVTVESKTVHPVLVLDKETGTLLCDSPGFKDTRSAQHEVVATYDMKRVIDLSKRVKIAIVITHSSVQIGKNRIDFPNVLKHVLDFVQDIDKYIDSIYLIPTKVENAVYRRKDKLFLVSDETMINNIAAFMNETRMAFKQSLDIGGDDDQKRQFYKDAVKLIDKLMSRDEKGYKRIAIFRKPDEPGPISNIETVINSRTAIRKMLLNDNTFTDVYAEDFGYTISENAILYLNELYERMNAYVTSVTESLGSTIIKYYSSRFDSYYDIDTIISNLTEAKSSFENITRDIGTCKTPGEYAVIVQNFSTDENLNICDEIFTDILTLNGYLENLKNLSGINHYTPTVWNSSLLTLDRYISNEEKYYVMVKSVWGVLSDYDYRRKNPLYELSSKNVKPWKQQQLLNRRKYINNNNFNYFLQKLKLSQYADVVLNDEKLDVLDGLVEGSMKNYVNTLCDDQTMLVTGEFLLTQEINQNTMRYCEGAKTVVIVAAHTLYIDSNLDTDIIGGRNILMIAPKWVVKGKRHISVNGHPPEAALTKAWRGAIGKDGKDGASAGSFVGVGMVFENVKDLTITANGADGQQGQEGGDGRNGENGDDGVKNLRIASSSNVYLLYNQFKETDIIKGKPGTPGEDAGAGGLGGEKGLAGKITMFGLGQEQPSPSTFAIDGKQGRPGKDGTPGKGGFNGCDKRIERKDKYILIIPFGKSESSDFIDCRRINPDGKVLEPHRLTSLSAQFGGDKRTPIPPVCSMYNRQENVNLRQNMKNVLCYNLLDKFDKEMEKRFGC